MEGSIVGGSIVRLPVREADGVEVLAAAVAVPDVDPLVLRGSRNRVQESGAGIRCQ